jgi:hypothetical protein
MRCPGEEAQLRVLLFLPGLRHTNRRFCAYASATRTISGKRAQQYPVLGIRGDRRTPSDCSWLYLRTLVLAQCAGEDLHPFAVFCVDDLTVVIGEAGAPS